jgi:hypothetical protein
MELEKLFNTFISYGEYVREYEKDGLECWNIIKEIVNEAIEEDNHKPNSIDKILGIEWQITRIIKNEDVNVNINDLEKIYIYVHDTLKMYGENNDHIKYQIDSDSQLKYHFYLQLARIPFNNNLELVRLLQIAYNIGQLSVHLDNDSIFTPEAKDYYQINKLHDINSYINLDDKNFDDDQKDILNKIMIDVREKISIVLTGGFRKKNFNDVENLESKTNYLNKYLKYKKKYLSLKKYT